MTKPKTLIMKLLLLIVLLCGINSTSHHNAKTKKGASHQKATTNFDMVPSGLLFQF